jgi:hypothetical protein
LRRRILDIVNRKGPITDMALWRESAPDFLPWKFMLKELWAMHDEGKLRLEIKSPGNWILHSVEVQPAEKTAAVQSAQKMKLRTAAKRKKPAKQKKEVSVG